VEHVISGKNNIQSAFILVFSLKILMLAVFSSGYQDDLFIPFVLEFLGNGGNPWEYASVEPEAFPYPPLMLYILSLFMAPVYYLGGSSLWSGFFYGFPLLLSDLVITLILLKMFTEHKINVLVIYFCSPLIFFSTYLHGQLDILPTAFLFSSVYLLSNRKYLYSSIVAGLAISIKLHTVAALPLMTIYLLNQGKLKETVYMCAIPVAIFIGFALPYVTAGGGFIDLVIQNQKQSMIFDSFVYVGGMKVYLPILVATAIYFRFAAYRKVNIDLLYAAMGALFSIFLLLIVPSPGWYVWIVPFFTIFYIRYFEGVKHYFLHFSLVVFYLLYYVLFHQYEYVKFMFLGQPILLGDGLGISGLANITFTMLQSVLIITIYQFYKNSIYSNDIYSMDKAFVIGIGGDSGAGKSTLINDLQDILGDKLLQLEGDSDHKWERGDEMWLEYTHLDPKANFLHQQAEQLGQLKNRKSILRSDYNHSTGKFTVADKILAKDFVVLAGLHPFYLPKMRKVIDLRIFLNLDERLRRSWKIERDMADRGYSEEQILHSLAKREYDSEKYIKPQEQFGDLNICYFPSQLDKFEGNIYKGLLGLKVTMNANVPLDSVIKSFQASGYSIDWDYSPDLHAQHIVFHTEPQNLDIDWYVNQFITNSAELVLHPQWQEGYAGIIQFLIVLAISENMKERAIKNV
jgi:uridine kinase